MALTDIPWEQHKSGYGRMRPRLESWHGDAGAVYASYNGGMQPRPWTPALMEIKALVEEATGLRYNGVLLNLYRNQHDSVDKHSDDDPEFGPNPTIASVSLGAERRFVVRSKTTREKRTLRLTHGSLLVMSGNSQANYRHEVPKEKAACAERINLTFRRILM